ncbi:MAG: HlyD family secretion protein [Janthinobacterium lividum]
MTETAAPTWSPARRNRAAIAITVILALAALLAVLSAWDLPPFADGSIATENAYVRGRTTVIAPQASGYVSEVLVHDYQQVRAGQILVRIDDSSYRARLEQARANLAAALATLANATQARASRGANLLGQLAGISGARAQLLKAQADMTRATDLARDGSISIRERDQTLAALALADAQLHQSLAGAEIGRQDVRTVDVGRGGLAAQVDGARSQVHAAEIDLDHTVIRAPESGQLGEVAVRLGAFVTNGTQLMAVVPPERWIIANFKEAQTARILTRQRVTFTADAMPGLRFTGTVEQISPAAGSEFSVIKPDNGTGNFIKVPQRIGVRILVDPDQRQAAGLRPGMSVDVRVETAR